MEKTGYGRTPSCTEFTKYNVGHQTKNDNTEGPYSMHVNDEKCIQIFCRKCGGREGWKIYLCSRG